MEGSTAATQKQKAKYKGNKKEDKDKSTKGKVSKGKGKDIILNSAKFEGQGLSYKAKLFGFVEVPGPRGDESSVKAIQKLKQQARQMKKGANEHKLKIIINITLQGIRLHNEKTQTIEHEHPIHKISFISHDPEDKHVFGYIYSPPRSSQSESRKYFLFAIKSEKSADVITIQLYELFQVVYKMQEHRKNSMKGNAMNKPKQQQVKSPQPLEPLQDKMLLEMSNKIGGDQQQYQQEEHLYAEPNLPKKNSAVPSEYAVPFIRASETVGASGDNVYQVPRTDKDELSEKEREDIATAIALSLSMQENSTVSQENHTATTRKDDPPPFQAVFESPNASSQDSHTYENSFRAQFPPFENGWSNSQDLKSAPESIKSSYDPTHIYATVSPEVRKKTSNASSISSLDLDAKLDVESLDNNSEKLPSEDASEEGADKFKSTKDSDSNNEFVSRPFDDEPRDFFFGNEENTELSLKETEKAKENAYDVVSNKPSVARTSFAVNFDSEKESVNSSKHSEPDTFAFGDTSNVFPNDDPFSSSGPSEFDESTLPSFSDNDPFSPRMGGGGGGNVEIKDDPFAGNDNLFADDPFREDPTTGELAQPEVPDTAAAEGSGVKGVRDSANDDDVFPEILEAKADAVESAEKNEREGEVIVDQELSFEVRDPPEESKAGTAENRPTRIFLQFQHSSDDVIPRSDTSHDESESKSNTDEHAFDFSPEDVHVTANTSAEGVAQSPTEFSPPPLPPRPGIPPREPGDAPSGTPKIPPALPPRPTANVPSSCSVETTRRTPPKLPPRIDLEDLSSFGDEPFDVEGDPIAGDPGSAPLAGHVPDVFPDTGEEPRSFTTETFGESNTVSIGNTNLSSGENTSRTFQANFDAFDFENVDENSPTRNKTPTPIFDSNDLFNDPFGDTDPFQTPIVGDPFATSTSFDQVMPQSSDDFDPFSGDDPFATTPTFDSKVTFDTNGDTEGLPSGDVNNEQDKKMISPSHSVDEIHGVAIQR